MLVNPVMTIFRVLTWCCVIAFAVLSLLPAQELADLSLLPALEMARTRLPPQLEHFFAYAGAAAIAMASYGPSRGSTRIIGGLWMCAGILEYLRHFFARSASVDRGFRGVGAGSFVRRARRRPPLASPVGSAALRGRGSAFCTLPSVPTH